MAPTPNQTPQKNQQGRKNKKLVNGKNVRGGNGGPQGGPGRFLMPGGGGFTSNLVSIILIFLLLISAYTLVESGTKAKPVISLSQVANDVKAGDVTAIQVSGNDLTLTYKGGEQKTSMKD